MTEVFRGFLQYRQDIVQQITTAYHHIPPRSSFTNQLPNLIPRYITLAVDTASSDNRINERVRFRTPSGRNCLDPRDTVNDARSEFFTAMKGSSRGLVGCDAVW
jgi:hypothetical protein